MARRVIWGTPGRTKHYVRLRRAYALILPTLALAFLIPMLYFGSQALGWRSPLSPGRVSSRHASYDTRCEECHLSRGGGVSDVRCERCHDPSSGGRLDHAAHVYFGSLDPQKAAAAGPLECARCHVEHKGAAFDLKQVAQSRCVHCHDDGRQVGTPFRSLAGHPEFRVLRAKAQQVTGIIYSHLTHVTRGKGKKAGYVLLNPERRLRGIDAPAKTCNECHGRDPGATDFEPITFEAHCVDCHRSDVKMDPVSAAEVVPIDAVAGANEALTRNWAARADDFEASGETLAKPRVHHKDEWVLFNLRKLRRELDPDGFASERGALLARRDRIERRLVLARPLAQEGLEALEARAGAVKAELAYIQERLRAQTAAIEPAAGQVRLDEIAAALRAAGGAPPGADASGGAGLVGGAPGRLQPMSSDDFAARRDELLRLLEAVEQADPRRKAQVEELRGRLGALRPGDTSIDLLTRARDQRLAALERLRDELELRRSGTKPPAETLLRSEIRLLERSLQEVGDEIALYDALPAPAGELTPEGRDRKEEAVANLSVGCRYCHEVSAQGALARVAVARPVLRRATFSHKDHLTHGEACADCHAGTSSGKPWSIETSAQSSDLAFKGVASCRECHKPRAAGTDCKKCHDYHPRAVP